MTNVNRILQGERVGQFCEIIGVRVQVVTIPWLTGSPVTPPVMCDAAVTSLGQEKHLVLECVRAQRPAMTENNRLSLAPILVVDLRSVFCRDSAHTLPPS